MKKIILCIICSLFAVTTGNCDDKAASKHQTAPLPSPPAAPSAPDFAMKESNEKIIERQQKYIELLKNKIKLLEQKIEAYQKKEAKQ